MALGLARPAAASLDHAVRDDVGIDLELVLALDLEQVVLELVGRALRGPDRSCWQIVANVFWPGNWSSSDLIRTAGSATSVFLSPPTYMHVCASAGNTAFRSGSTTVTGSLGPMMPATTTLWGSVLSDLRNVA